MNRQLFCGITICVILWFCAVATSEETVEDKRKKEAQLSADVYILKEWVEGLHRDVEVLNKKSNSQIVLLKEIKDEAEQKTYGEGVCDRIYGNFNKTHRNLNMFEERVVTKLMEIQDEQSSNFHKVLVRSSLSKNCQPDSSSDVMPIALSEINEKIEKFEAQFKKFESLEEKLKQQQTEFQTANEEQMKILREINAKLTQNQEKLETLERDLPNLVQVTTEASSSAFQKVHKFPMEYILGMTQNQAKNLPKAS